MRTIKLYEGIDLTVDGQKHFCPDMTAFDMVNIPDDARMAVLQRLMAFGYMDLSPAYDGHTVTMKLIPA